MGITLGVAQSYTEGVTLRRVVHPERQGTYDAKCPSCGVYFTYQDEDVYYDTGGFFSDSLGGVVDCPKCGKKLVVFPDETL